MAGPTRIPRSRPSAVAQASQTATPSPRSRGQRAVIPTGEEIANKENLDTTAENPASLAKKDGGGRTVEVNWSLPANHHLTDELLTQIEDHAAMRVMLGFDKGTQKTVNSSSRKPRDFHRLIAERVLYERYPSIERRKLDNSVKNRVQYLKSRYTTHRGSLLQTGQGLVAEDHEDEIQTGAELANIWDKILKDFPWYKRVDRLYRSSPVVDTSAVSNSSSELDLSVLERCQSTPSLDPSLLDPALFYEENGEAASQETVPETEECSAPTDMLSFPQSTPPDKKPLASNTPGRRKSAILETIFELHAQGQETRRDSMEKYMGERRELAEAKMRAQMESAKMTLEHKERQREKDWELEREKMAHEREILQMKIELAKLQSGTIFNS